MNDLLDAAREWLERQPGIRPWTDGRSRIVARVGGWIEEYGAAACGRAPAAEEPLRPQSAAKLWRCWEYHWRQAAELNGGKADGFDVATRLEAGLGFKAGGRLGGNPLEDVVLAVAVLHHEPAAIARFSDRFRNDVVRVAAKGNPRVREDEEDW